MKTIYNSSSRNNDDMTNNLRTAIEHRATWMGLMCLEAKRAGADWETIARNAIKQTGGLHGEKILEATNNSEDMEQFAAAFLKDTSRNIFEMDVQKSEPTELYVEFHYCPLVSAWQKIGIEQDMIATLCDIAMDGDRSIAEKAGYDFELGNTIAKGGAVCEVCFRSRTKTEE